MNEEQHQNMIDLVKEKRIKPIEVMIYDGPDGKWVLPMDTKLSPMKIVDANVILMSLSAIHRA